MARTFHRKRTLTPMAELNVTNMIDLGFSLLIVFMITTPLMQQEQTVPLQLPVESARQQAPREDRFQAISIDRNGNYYFGAEPVGYEQLAERVAGLARQSPPPVVNIRADLSLQYQRVITLIDLLKEHRLTRISLDTRAAD